MAVKDDLPSDEVARKRKISRETSRRHLEKRSKQKKETKRTNPRTVAAVARSKIKEHAANENKLEFGTGFGFQVAARHSTNWSKFGEHVEGKFTKWEMSCNPSTNKQGNVVLPEVANVNCPKYIMYLNRNFNHPTRDSNFIPWVSIRRSSLVDSEGCPVGNGLFAERVFAKGDTIGVFTGEIVQLTKETTHIQKRYCMQFHGGKSGVDAKGGVGSGHPIGMAMHMINDPHYQLISHDSNPNRHLSANVEFQSGGLCVATRRVPSGKELLVHYSSGGVSQLLL